mgnify:CR=1 FL=1
MGLNDKPSGERLHIAFFGMRNAGKSSVVNAVTGQTLSLVSEHMGTTTDPVQKAMKLFFLSDAPEPPDHLFQLTKGDGAVADRPCRNH